MFYRTKVGDQEDMSAEHWNGSDHHLHHQQVHFHGNQAPPNAPQRSMGSNPMLHAMG